MGEHEKMSETASKPTLHWIMRYQWVSLSVVFLLFRKACPSQRFHPKWQPKQKLSRLEILGIGTTQWIRATIQKETVATWWFQPIWKILVNLIIWIISPSRGENKKCSKPPPRLSNVGSRSTCLSTRGEVLDKDTTSLHFIRVGFLNIGGSNLFVATSTLRPKSDFLGIHFWSGYYGCWSLIIVFLFGLNFPSPHVLKLWSLNQKYPKMQQLQLQNTSKLRYAPSSKLSDFFWIEKHKRHQCKSVGKGTTLGVISERPCFAMPCFEREPKGSKKKSSISMGIFGVNL